MCFLDPVRCFGVLRGELSHCGDTTTNQPTMGDDSEVAFTLQVTPTQAPKGYSYGLIAHRYLSIGAAPSTRLCMLVMHSSTSLAILGMKLSTSIECLNPTPSQSIHKASDVEMKILLARRLPRYVIVVVFSSGLLLQGMRGLGKVHRVKRPSLNLTVHMHVPYMGKTERNFWLRPSRLFIANTRV